MAYTMNQGLLQYDPAQMQKQALYRGLLQAGAGLLGQGPSQYPIGIGQSIGQGISGFASGVDQGRQDYMGGLTQQMQMAQYQREQQEREAQQKWVESLPLKDQPLAKAYPSAVAGGYADRMFATPEAPKTREVRRGSNTVTEQWNSGAGKWEEVGSGPSWNPNPSTVVNVGDDMKLTEGQSSDISNYGRMIYAEQKLQPLEKALTEYGSAAAAQGGPLTNWMKTNEYRQAERAKKEWLAVILKKASGAQITKVDLEMYEPTYFPVPGDDEQTIADKREARKIAMVGLRNGLGNAKHLADAVEEDVMKEFGGEGASGQDDAQPPPEAKQAPDGKYYVPDPQRPGKYLQWVP